MALKNGRYLRKLCFEIESASPFNINSDDGELLVDSESSSIYLPGTIIAGAMRNYLSENDFNDIEEMFGEGTGISKIFFYDAFANFHGIEIRPGVRIDGFSGTVKKQKFERKFASSGHKFKINISIFANDGQKLINYTTAIYSAIAAIDNGFITFGSYKSTGSGLFKVNNISERCFNFHDKEDLFSYITNSYKLQSLSMNKIIEQDNHRVNIVSFKFEGHIKTPLLIKGLPSNDSNEPDDKQLTDKDGNCIIPGSSLKGIIRGQAEKILKMAGSTNLLEDIFGSSDETRGCSRLKVFDTKINKEEVKTAIYNKIKIDRFTGGTIMQNKMESKPIIGYVSIAASLRLTKESGADIALISLAFRDLADGTLSIGSGYSDGRGRIEGKTLEITKGKEVLFKWNSADSITINKIDDLISKLKEVI